MKRTAAIASVALALRVARGTPPDPDTFWAAGFWASDFWATGFWA